MYKVWNIFKAKLQGSTVKGTIEWVELGHWCELGQKFGESSPLQLLVKGHWCDLGQKFSKLLSLQCLVKAF